MAQMSAEDFLAAIAIASDEELRVQCLRLNIKVGGDRDTLLARLNEHVANVQNGQRQPAANIEHQPPLNTGEPQNFHQQPPVLNGAPADGELLRRERELL